MSYESNLTSASVLEAISVSLEISFDTFRLSFLHFFLPHFSFCCFLKMIDELIYTVKSVSMPISSCTLVTANVGRVKLL